MGVRFEVKGLSHTLEVFESIRDQVGDAKKSSRILTKVAFQAMKPVLAMAQTLTGEHSKTGMLHDSLTITSGRPTRKDMQSKYVLPTDSAIAKVSTRAIPKHLKRAFNTQYSHLLASGKKDEFRRARKKFYAERNIFYDARAIANEFGTANRSAEPFLRISLETQQQEVSDLVGLLLDQELQRFKMTNTTTT